MNYLDAFDKVEVQESGKKLYDVEYYPLPDVRGTAIIQEVLQAGDDFTKRFFIKMRIVDCIAKKPGGQVHKPGEIVKTQYNVSDSDAKKRSIAQQGFKRDVCAAFGSDPKTEWDDVKDALSNPDNPFYKFSGLLVKFDTKRWPDRDDGTPSERASTFFHAIDAEGGNTPEAVAERRKSVKLETVV